MILCLTLLTNFDSVLFLECIPPSLRFFSGNEQVDLARKMQEDPLYAIKKKEVETRNQLLKNPVKLKQLRVLVSRYILLRIDKKGNFLLYLSNNRLICERKISK